VKQFAREGKSVGKKDLKIWNDESKEATEDTRMYSISLNQNKQTERQGTSPKSGRNTGSYTHKTSICKLFGNTLTGRQREKKTSH
jgi:hypothetical protein